MIHQSVFKKKNDISPGRVAGGGGVNTLFRCLECHKEDHVTLQQTSPVVSIQGGYDMIKELSSFREKSTWQLLFSL